MEWAILWSYEKRTVENSITLLKAIREHILQILEYAPDGWTRSVQFRDKNGEIEIVPIGIVIQMQTNHLDHHVKRILEIRKEINGN